MAMGNGSAIDAESIDASVRVMQKQLDKGVHKVQYKHTQGGQFEQRNGRPREARITVTPGIHQVGGYFDIQWWENGDYKYHYREQGLEFRFGREESNQSTEMPVRHFHPPDDVTKHLPSCIGGGHPPERVTLAVIATWWAAVKAGDESVLNTQDGLP
ncbi:hypothetical protein [Haloferax profundi]|nr:hypothetical protein [Haloferax profundi]